MINYGLGFEQLRKSANKLTPLSPVVWGIQYFASQHSSVFLWRCTEGLHECETSTARELENTKQKNGASCV